MSFDEYKRFAFMVINAMQEFERQGEENVRQNDIVERLVN